MAARARPTRWVHLNEASGDPWVLPIWGAVNAAIAAGRVKPLTARLSELGLHISIRLNFLPRIVKRINEETKALNLAVRRRPKDREFIAGRPAYVLRINDDLKYRLLIDIDSLLFELNAIYEHWLEFFKALYSYVGVAMPQPKADDSVRSVMATGGESNQWLDDLNEYRNYFMHRGTPYLAVDISTAKYDPLFLKSNVSDLSVSDQYVRLSEIDAVVQGFRKAKPLVRDHLMGPFQ